MKKELFLCLIRGASGAGKTSLANAITPPGVVISADDFFINKESGKYEFDMNKISQAHHYCQTTTKSHMINKIERIYVANTFTNEWEMAAYFDLAKKYKYKIFTVIVENRHSGINVHDVPEKTLQKQKSRFNIKL